MSLKKTIAFNTASQLLGKFLSGITTFVISFLLARSLGVEGYGDFTKITAFVAFFYLFADFGLNAIYIQFSKNKNADTEKHILLTTRILISLILMFFMIAVVAFLPGFGNQGFSPSVKLGIILFAPTILLQALITTTNAYFQETLHYEYATYATAAGSFVTLILLLIAVSIFLPSFGLFAALFATIAGSLIAVIISFLFAKKLKGVLRIFWDGKQIRNMILSAAPLGITLMFNVVYFRIDTFILTITRSTNEVGIYGLAYKFFELALVVPTFAMNAIFPSLVEAMTQKNMEVFWKRVKIAFTVLAVCSVFVFVGGWFLAPFVVYIRPEFSLSIAPLRILLVSLPFFYLTSVTMWLLVVFKKRWQMIVVYGLSMLINIIANSLFIPQGGYIAAAWITGISEGIVLILSYLFLRSS